MSFLVEEGSTTPNQPIWLNSKWTKETNSFVFLQEETKTDNNTKVFNSTYMTNGLGSGKVYVRSKVYGKHWAKIIFGLSGEQEIPFDGEVAMTVCRMPPTVTTGIQTLNMMLDPSKTKDREKKIGLAQEKYNKDFGELDLAKSYVKLLELLWYSRLPCFDVKGLTSEQKDEMSVIKRCYWRGEMVDCASIFVTRSTDRGMCCTFNVGNAESIFVDTTYRNITSYLQKRDKKDSFGGEEKV